MAMTRPISEQVKFTQEGAGAAVRLASDKLRETVSVKDFGAIGDGVTDDTAAIQAALNYAYNTFGGGEVYIGNGRYILRGDLVVPRYTTLKGPFGHTSSSTKNWTILPGTLILNPSYSIIVKAGAAIDGCCIIREGLSPSVLDGDASFSGVAVIPDEADACVLNNAIIGFEYGIFNDASSPRPRLNIQGNAIDAKNGISVGFTSDTSRICYNHMFPYTSPAIGPSHLRSGIGIRCYGNHQWTMLRENLIYGYSIGISIENCNTVTSIGDNIDYPGEQYVPTRTNVGVHISGNSSLNKFIGLRAAAAQTGVIVNIGLNQIASFYDSTLWAHKDESLRVQSGDVSLSNSIIRKNDTGTQKGCIAEGVNSVIRIVGTRFENFSSVSDHTSEINGRIVWEVCDGVEFSRNSLYDAFYRITAPATRTSRLYLDTDGVQDGSYIGFLESGGGSLVFNILNTELARLTTQYFGIKTGLPRASLHSVGTNIIGAGTGAIANTVLDDNPGPQINIWLDESTNELNFKVIYSGAAGDTNRTVKSGKIQLT